MSGNSSKEKKKCNNRWNPLVNLCILVLEAFLFSYGRCVYSDVQKLSSRICVYCTLALRAVVDAGIKKCSLFIYAIDIFCFVFEAIHFLCDFVRRHRFNFQHFSLCRFACVVFFPLFGSVMTHPPFKHAHKSWQTLVKDEREKKK